MSAESVGEQATASCWLCGFTAPRDPRLGPVGYARCQSCGLVFQPARHSATDEVGRYTGRYFDEYPHPKGGVQDYDEDEAQRRLEAGRRMEWVRSYARRGRLLEVGAASGAFVGAAQELGFEASGVEPADSTAAKGRARGLALRTGTLDDMHQSGETFDIVCAWHVLEHLPEPRRSAKQLVDLLRPGGFLFLELPNIGSQLARKRGLLWQHLDPDNHVVHYDVSNVERLFREHTAGTVAVNTMSMRTYARASFPVRALLAMREALQVGTIRLTDPTRQELLRVVVRSNEG
jgi:2-polyprenyl-3-methyl-5-hydroxy-6-metoxy-1,4-benzoquinol methylase